MQTKFLKRITREQKTWKFYFKYVGMKRVLSGLDTNISSWQIPPSPEFREYTAFLYREKCHELNFTPFGLKTRTAALVRGLDKVLKSLNEFITSYVDDLLVASDSEEEHLYHLELIQERFKEYNITLNFNKCEFQ